MKSHVKSLIVSSLGAVCMIANLAAAGLYESETLNLPSVTAAPTARSAEEPLLLAWCQGMTYGGRAYPSYAAMNRAKARDAAAARRSAAASASRERSSQVRSDQDSLKSLGYYGGEVDGRVGPATVSAIRQFRVANNLGPGTTLDASARKMIADGSAVSKQSASTPGKSRSPRDDQQALADLGFYKGPIDGVPGPMTRTAIREFKTKHGLNSQNATIDDTTRAKLDEALAAR